VKQRYGAGRGSENHRFRPGGRLLERPRGYPLISAHFPGRRHILILTDGAGANRYVDNQSRRELPCKTIYTQEEMLRLLLAAGELRPFLYALYSLAARVGELNRLRWEDVNFARREVVLWTKKGDGTWREQKKPLNTDLYGELKRLYGTGKDVGVYVFPNPETGQPFVDRRK
jgi:integrase